MSEFMLLIYTDQTKIAGLQPSDWDAIHADYVSITQAMNEAGVNKGGNPLQGPDTARTVGPDGVVTDGPFAEITEVLGGYYLLDVADQDEALAWAAKLPGVTRGLDKIEVRPIQPFMM
ncbi:MAG: YCII-related protein [Actinomycetia bacterium]|nr:YCII-related protein [Actinomycetes bacterium]